MSAQLILQLRRAARSVLLTIPVFLLAIPGRASAADGGGTFVPHLTFTFVATPEAAPSPVRLGWPASIGFAEATDADAQRPVVVQYSDGYRLRAKIHKIASIASLPLFAAEGFVGQSLYNNRTPGRRNAHLALAAGIGGLFAINSVTGVWNLVEARKDPNGRGRRMLHGILMLAADAGFLATAATGPGDGEEGRRLGGTRSAGTHRAMAFTSLGLATAGYLVMLIGGR